MPVVCETSGSRHTILKVCEFRFWQLRDCGGHIFPRKNANFGHFEVAFDRPEFDRTQWCLYSLSNAFDRQQSLHFFVCVYVCPQIRCRMITSAVLCGFSANFTCRSEIWLFWRLLFLGLNGSRLPILEVCRVYFCSFAIVVNTERRKESDLSEN